MDAALVAALVRIATATGLVFGILVVQALFLGLGREGVGFKPDGRIDWSTRLTIAVVTYGLVQGALHATL